MSRPGVSRDGEHLDRPIEADGPGSLEEHDVSVAQQALEETRRGARCRGVLHGFPGKSAVDGFFAVEASEIADADQPVHAGGGVAAELAVPDVLVFAELPHVSEDRDSTRGREAGERVERGAQRGRVRVVGVVVEQGPGRVAAELAAVRRRRDPGGRGRAVLRRCPDGDGDGGCREEVHGLVDSGDEAG